MDTEHLRTFLAVVEAGTMLRASERLHLTQAAVSTRLRLLEEELGQKLFERSKSGSALTPAGQSFLPQAKRWLDEWERAKQELGAPAERTRLRLGGEFSLASAVLLNWLETLRAERPDLELEAMVENPLALVEALLDKRLDLALVYSPLKRKGISASLVLDEELILVSTEQPRAQLEPARYVYVDWGPDFRAAHDAAFPELHSCPTRIGLGPLALRYLLRVGGSGYFRARAVRPFLQEGRLFRVPRSPRFSYSIFALTHQAAHRELLNLAEETLIRSASRPPETWI